MSSANKLFRVKRQLCTAEMPKMFAKDAEIDISLVVISAISD